jgi:8-oxo-dGTP diphosphatase
MSQPVAKRLTCKSSPVYTAAMSNNQEKQERFTVIPSVYLALRREGEILLLRRAHTGYMDGSYCLVAGHLEAGESAKTAMVREAKEEAGIIINADDMQLVHTGHRFNRGRLDLIFETRTWQGEIVNAEPDKCDDLSWYPLDNLPETTVPYVRLILDAISKGIAYSEYFEKV